MHDAETVRLAVTSARENLVDREVLAEVVALCAVAGEHLLVIGPPGTAKSQVVRLVAERLGGRYFEYLLGRFTEPNEIFGPVDLRRLREGVVEIETAGMLPEAEVAFLDEVFLGSTAILNTLLSILNERMFRRGNTELRVPLRVCVGASNTLPEDPALAAFADRFLARVFLEPVPDARLEELLESGWAASRPLASPAPEASSTGAVPGNPSVLAALDRLEQSALGCDLSGVQGDLASAVRRMRSAGVALSDRRAVRSQRLVAAAAVLDGRDHATPADLWVLPLVAPTADAQATIREALADVLAQGRSSTLLGAAEDFARGPAARADRLARTGTELLAGHGELPAEPEQRLRLEATLREIDSAFDPAHLPDHLAEIRTRLVEAVQG
jgi:MoxR-like ATPase